MAVELWSLFLALVLGTATGFILGLIPGLGGKTSVIIFTPVALLWSGIEGAVFLVALHSVIHTSSSIPAIAFGVPASSSDLATVQDGFPLTKQGRAGEALGASLSASAIAGLLGALALLAFVPFARSLVTSFGPPEFLLFGCIGLTLVATVSGSGLRRGLITCALGVLLSMVGVHPVTSTPRFTLGTYDLWSGIPIQVIVAGIFVVPEMTSIVYRNKFQTYAPSSDYSMAAVLRGMRATLSYWSLVIRSSVYGFLIGVLPGVGSSVACWWSYAYAKRNVKSDVPYGQGALPGVIAPEAANNSKEGGALLPTLLLGIPGSSVMAIIMVALITLGIPIGPQLAAETPEVAYLLGATVIFSNLLAVPFFLAIVPYVSKISFDKTSYMAIVAVAIALGAAISKNPTLSIYVMLAIGCIVGISLEICNWSRAPLLLGFVLGRMIETSFYQTAQLWGWDAFTRLTFIALLPVAIIAILRVRAMSAEAESDVRDHRLLVFFLFVIFFASALYASCFQTEGRAFTLIISLGALGLLLPLFKSLEPGFEYKWLGRLKPPLLLLIVAFLLGLPVAIGAYAGYSIWLKNESWRGATMVFFGAAVLTGLLCSLVGMFPSREALGWIAWRVLDY